MAETPRYHMQRLTDAQFGAEYLVNEALNIIDAFLNLVITGSNQSSAPDNPPEGSCYIVAQNATGLFDDQDYNIAVYYDGWNFYVPGVGQIAYAQDTGKYIRWDGSTWVDFGGETVYNAGTISANTTFDLQGRGFIYLTQAAAATLTLNNGQYQGQKLTIRIKQDGTGGFAVTWSGNVRQFSGVGTANTAANKTTYYEFRWHSTDSKWDLLKIYAEV